MRRLRGQVAIVTGASSGIGLAITQELLKHGLTVVGLSRNTISLPPASTIDGIAPKFHALQCDLSNENDITAALEWTLRHVGAPHVLINNAGVNPGAGTDILNGQPADWRTCLAVNVIGLALIAQRTTQMMLARNIRGHVINIGSDLAHVKQYVPTMSLYAASKHAVAVITDLLRQEIALQPPPLQNAGAAIDRNRIKVTSISPGYVATRFINDQTRAPLADDIARYWFLECEDVVDAVIYALSTPERVNIAEITLLNFEKS